MDQMLKDHDRHVQEAVRRARLDKAKAKKIQIEGNQLSANSLFVSGRWLSTASEAAKNSEKREATIENHS